jgi:cephalosporin hydroxylase
MKEENVSAYSDNIPDGSEFEKQRVVWRKDMSESAKLRSDAVELITAADLFHFGYQWEWCGIPIIRHPDDIVLQQEIMWNLKPAHVIETGVARGGSLALSSSLLEINGTKSRVLGIDIQILPHAIDALRPWTADGRIQLVECDSTSSEAIKAVEKFLEGNLSPALLVLDSNHSHEHVIKELQALTPMLPVGSIVIVADTIIEEMPDAHYRNRPWGRGNNPYTAVNEFLKLNPAFKLDQRYSRRSLMGECRDGIMIRISNSLPQ